MYVELITCVCFTLTIPVAEESLFYQTQNSTLLIYKVLDIPTLYLVSIIRYVVVL